MDTRKIDVKILVEDGPLPALSELVPVFHGWIQQLRVPDELLIDVANYAHVPDGPGVMLLGHEGHYSLELTCGVGFVYSQRRPPGELDFEQALARAVRRALLGCSLLEAESALSVPLRFRADRWLVSVNDRLQAPNQSSTWESVEPACRAVLSRLWGDSLTLEPVAPGRERFGFHVSSPAKLSIAELTARA